ncbi:glycosyltransferase family 2 protein [Desulfovibrio sp.]
MPRITVAMPVYNDSLYLQESINSILKQRFNDFTLLIIDDGSTDNSPSIISKYNDKRIKIIHHNKNMGRSIARNTALATADSEYLAWMDADDIAKADRLQKQIMFLDEHPQISICGGYVLRFNEGTGIAKHPCHPERIAAQTIFQPAILNPTAMMRLADLRKISLQYDAGFSRAEDFVFWIQAFLYYNLKGANLNTILCNYREFNRKTTFFWHSLAIQKYIAPWLNIDMSPEEIAIHAGLSNPQRAQFIQQYGFEAILSWLDRLYIHFKQSHFAYTPAVNTILQEYAERIIASSANPITALNVYKKTALSHTHKPVFLYFRTLARMGKKILNHLA